MQRRFPKGLKVHVHSLDRFGCLAALARVLHQVRRQQRDILDWDATLPGMHCTAWDALLASKQVGLAAAQQDGRLPGQPHFQQAPVLTLVQHPPNLSPRPNIVQAGLSVTRAKVRTYATSKSSGHTFYVMDAKGGPPDK